MNSVEEVKYDELFCEACQERTSHVEIDTWDGKDWQCEVCGNKKYSCKNCGSVKRRQVTPRELEKEDPQGYKEFGFYSFIECENCGNREFDD